MVFVGCSAPTCSRSTKPPDPVVAPPVPTAVASAVASAEEGPKQQEPMSAAMSEVSDYIDHLRRGGRRSIHYVEPQEREEHAFTEWVAAVARGAQKDTEPTVNPPSGFVLQRFQGGMWLLSEGQQRRGAGAVVIRIGPAAPMLVEAPHTFFDSGTLPIALAVFERQHARALLVNTAHRYVARLGKEPEQNAREEDSTASISDVAHTKRSFFLAAHNALLAVDPGAWTVQLHGFQDASAKGVDVILSASVTNADTTPVARELGDLLGAASVRTYPDEIKVLGALTNIQAESSKRAGAPFLHIEMSRSLRDKLVADTTLRSRFAAAIAPVRRADLER